MTDFRALCAELADRLQRAITWGDIPEDVFDLMQRARIALAHPEPQGPLKNCWLDDEPTVYPSPCVFDDPSEMIENCIYAQKVKCKTDCKYYRTTQQPEPQGFTPDHVNLMCFAFEREPWATWLRRGGCLESAHCELSDLMLAVLARWGRPAIEPVPVAERLLGSASERFEFSVFDSEYEEQAGGTAPTYSQALSEGLHYLAVYAQDGPHSLELRRVEVLPHHALPVPQQEVDRG